MAIAQYVDTGKAADLGVCVWVILPDRLLGSDQPSIRWTARVEVLAEDPRSLPLRRFRLAVEEGIDEDAGSQGSWMSPAIPRNVGEGEEA